MHIYVSLLKQMAPEHLLATFAKICAEILAAASDGILSFDDVSCQSVLQVSVLSPSFLCLCIFPPEFSKRNYFFSLINISGARRKVYV